MHSFHHSRGRIVFEVLCALVIAASCYGAWAQTGASALLPAAAVAALYGLLHLFDLRQPRPARFVEPHRMALDDQPRSERPADAGSEQAAVVAEEPDAAGPALEAEPAKPKKPRASKPRRTKTMRKGGRRADDESVPVTANAPAEPEQDAAPSPPAFDEPAPSNIEPLFEPEPFVRMPRPAFGRKAG
jgi:hypothetical protein